MTKGTKILRRTQFGNPILRQKTRQLSKAEISSDKIQSLIANMHHTLANKKYGVGLAATQVGQGVAISVVGIKPTPSRPKLPTLNMTIINPKLIKKYGGKEPMWEGCVSFGATDNFPYAQVPRFRKVRVRYMDEHGKQHEKDFEGLEAQLMQHEIDHLNGILFVDRVEDTTSYMTVEEYKKRHAPAADATIEGAN